MTIKLGGGKNSLLLAALAQSDKSQIMPDYLETVTSSYQFFQIIHFAVLKVFCLATGATYEMVVVSSVSVRQFVAPTFLNMVNFREHSLATKQFNSSVHRGQIDVTIRQLFTHSSGSQRLIIMEKYLQNLAPRLCLAVPLGNQRLLEDF